MYTHYRARLGILAGSVIAIVSALAIGTPAAATTEPTLTVKAHNVVPATVSGPAGAAAPALSPSVKAELASGPSVCYQAYVQDQGWQGFWACDRAVAGTTGQSLRMEAIAIVTSGTGGICARAHVQNDGWLGEDCEPDGVEAVVGTEGLSLRMEALWLQVGTGIIHANAHVQNIGWQGEVFGNPIAVGTTGQSLRMEAIEIWV